MSIRVFQLIWNQIHNQVKKKTNGQSCSDQAGECDSSIGLSCSSSTGSSICSWVKIRLIFCFNLINLIESFLDAQRVNSLIQLTRRPNAVTIYFYIYLWSLVLSIKFYSNKRKQKDRRNELLWLAGRMRL